MPRCVDEPLLWRNNRRDSPTERCASGVILGAKWHSKSPEHGVCWHKIETDETAHSAMRRLGSAVRRARSARRARALLLDERRDLARAGPTARFADVPLGACARDRVRAGVARRPCTAPDLLPCAPAAAPRRATPRAAGSCRASRRWRPCSSSAPARAAAGPASLEIGGRRRAAAAARRRVRRRGRRARRVRRRAAARDRAVARRRLATSARTYRPRTRGGASAWSRGAAAAAAGAAGPAAAPGGGAAAAGAPVERLLVQRAHPEGFAAVELAARAGVRRLGGHGALYRARARGAPPRGAGLRRVACHALAGMGARVVTHDARARRRPRATTPRAGALCGEGAAAPPRRSSRPTAARRRACCATRRPTMAAATPAPAPARGRGPRRLLRGRVVAAGLHECERRGARPARARGSSSAGEAGAVETAAVRAHAAALVEGGSRRTRPRGCAGRP